ncbi:MAG TPA: chemotaxis protein [Burkholderiales bacterium]|nr:chemotaxis protein [Burkholderiales bacterium]
MHLAQDSNPLEAVDARTKLAGSNKLEILLFSLGKSETFGINVFKVREVTPTPPITRTPYVPPGVEGVISLRGNIIPVLSLAWFVNGGKHLGRLGQTMMVTEYSRRTQGFLVESVDRIVCVDWERVKAAESTVTGHDGLITAVTQLADGRLISILDVEQVLANAFGEPAIPTLQPVAQQTDAMVLFADDSLVARKQIAQVLDRLQVRYHQANNGQEAWQRLQAMAQRAGQDGQPLATQLRLILIDAEMPEMDGYVLTRHIKADRRFSGIPVVMHSSLSSAASRALGESVGVDAYVAKFDPVVLAGTLRRLLRPE